MQTDRKEALRYLGLGKHEPDPETERLLEECIREAESAADFRHLIREYGREVMGVGDCCEISGLAPGVMAQTGMETSEIIKGVVQEISPDLLIVIDALAARSTRRLCRTIQLTDTGIQPGSGVGNHRAALTKETLGIPVIAIGVPTVVEAAAIIYDAQGNCEQMPPHLNGMFVTPKNIDELIKQLSFTLSEALNMVFAHGEC